MQIKRTRKRGKEAGGTRKSISSLHTQNRRRIHNKHPKEKPLEVEIVQESPEEVVLRNDIIGQVLTPDWAKSPAWRWDLVTSFVANPTKTLRSYKADWTIINGANFYRTRYIHRESPERWRKQFPDISTAVDIYLQNQAEGIRWSLEALLMSPITDREVVQYLNLDITTEAIKYYRLLFFDIDSYRKSSIAMLSNVLAMSKLNTQDKVASDLLWKWFVYTYGPDEFMLELPGSEKESSKKFRKWSQELLKDNMFINACVLSTDIRRANSEGAIGVLTAAKAYMDIDSASADSIEDSAVSEMLSTIHKAVDIQLMSSDIKLDAIEKF